MTVHLIKLSVGPESLADLAARQKRRLAELKCNRQKPELIHITRHMPRRAEDVLDGGSIYWVIKGMICARQRLLELRPTLRDGIAHCGLVYDKKLIKVMPRPYRPFQGWRYFEPKDAPSDIEVATGIDKLPENVQRELAALGLI